jgi:hypothetical protein
MTTVYVFVLLILLPFAPLHSRSDGQQDGIVSLRIQDHSTNGPTQRYVLAYGSGPATCHFFFAFDTTGRAAKGTAYRFVPAYLAHRTDCHPYALLNDLAVAHGLKEVPHAGPHLNVLPLDAALFGTQLARGNVKQDAIAREFTFARRGSWTVLKLFFVDDEAEVFLALDPATGHADFLVKDPDYGEPLLRELGRILWE